MDDQAGCEEVGWFNFDGYEGFEGQQGSTSDAELSSFLDFILSQEVPPLSFPLPPEIDPFPGIQPLAPEQGFGLDPLVGDKSSPCSSGLSVNLEGKNSTDRRTGNQGVLVVKGLAAEGSPNGSSSLSATEGLGGHDGLSRGSRAVDREQVDVSPTRSLNTDQQGDDGARRKIRLMKNRESALQSRQRKKSYVKDLEAKCRMLESHCNQLQQAVAFKDMENCVLREELVRAKRVKNQKGVSLCVAEPAVLAKDSLPLESLSHKAYNSDGRYLVWMVPLFLLLLLLLMQGAPKRDPSGGNLNMGKTGSTHHHYMMWCRKRGLPSTKGGGRGRERSIWRWKCFAHNKRRKKRRFASCSPWKIYAVTLSVQFTLGSPMS
ncbi:hypothetical protein O6H91_18G024900 [Diphasiastrum complanatum]|uniref:Uncharacterized protein n=1 Tax=Diphasiastrum complanatum TaxID=34168 RepID=A0ACC2AYZ0_DIPCM|nr:hypothetical protein O6H91_18G024900 [Diphasiastrum complanatum]